MSPRYEAAEPRVKPGQYNTRAPTLNKYPVQPPQIHRCRWNKLMTEGNQIMKEKIHSVIHKYILSSYYVPYTVSGSGKMVGKQQILPLFPLVLKVWERSKTQP